MRIKADQSGKLENTSTHTVLAFSSGESRAVLIPALEKRKCQQALRGKRGKQHTWVFQVFAAALFLLVGEAWSKIDTLIIDVEYPGREGDIKGKLLELARKAGHNPRITFRRVGKRSAAHKKAITVFRGMALPDHILAAEEILSVL
jgi:hypothetical protein